MQTPTSTLELYIDWVPGATQLLAEYVRTVPITWWRHGMDRLSASLALCDGNPPVTGRFPHKRTVMRRIAVFMLGQQQYCRIPWQPQDMETFSSLLVFCDVTSMHGKWRNCGTTADPLQYAHVFVVFYFVVVVLSFLIDAWDTFVHIVNVKTTSM